MEIKDVFLVAFGIGAVLAAMWAAAIAGISVWNRAWAWIDDQEKHKDNQLIYWIMVKRGFTKDRNCDIYPWRRAGKVWGNDLSDGSGAMVFPMPVLFIAPSLLVSAFYLYPLTLTIIIVYLVARLARFARRHKKLFDKHIADPDAHKK